MCYWHYWHTHGLFPQKITFTNAFQEILDESNHKLNKISVDNVMKCQYIMEGKLLFLKDSLEI